MKRQIKTNKQIKKNKKIMQTNKNKKSETNKQKYQGNKQTNIDNTKYITTRQREWIARKCHQKSFQRHHNTTSCQDETCLALVVFLKDYPLG